MTRSLAKAETIDPRGGYAVRRPQATDAIGNTLRSAFGNDDSLPCDIACMLNRLKRLPG